MSPKSAVHSILTAPEAAKRFRLSQRHITRLIAQGKIVGRKAGGTWLVDPLSLQRFIATPRKPGPKPKR